MKRIRILNTDYLLKHFNAIVSQACNAYCGGGSYQVLITGCALILLGIMILGKGLSNDPLIEKILAVVKTVRGILTNMLLRLSFYIPI